MNKLSRQDIKRILKTRLQELAKVPVLLFPEQTKVVKDKSRRKIVVCSRRSGKSLLSLYYLIKTAIENPGSELAYIGLTRGSAKKVAWRGTQLRPALKELCKNLVPDDNWNEQELLVRFPNGSTIQLFGAEDRKARENLRGGTFKLVIVDECASYNELSYLIEDVLKMSTLDHDGTIMLIGTPGPPYNYFYDKFSDPNSEYAKFRWLTNMNPHIPKDVLEQLKSEYSPNSPSYRREILAEFAAAEDAVFTYTSDNIVEDREFDHEWNYVLGIDFGVRDDSALCLLAHSRYDPNIYVVDAFSKPDLTIADLAKHIQLMTARIPESQITRVYDSAALIYANELISRFNINMIPAKKQDKVGSIARANSLLYQNILLICRKANLLINELDILVWADTVREQWKNGLPDHIVDAWLYSLRFIYSQSEPDKKDPFEEKIKQYDPYEQRLIRDSLEKKAEQDRYKQLATFYGEDFYD